VTRKLVDIVGASSSSEIAVMNSLSMNVHTLLTSFYSPTKTRFRIIMEEAAFCSDHHVLSSQVRLRGLDPDRVIRQLTPRQGERTLRTDDILDAIREEGDALAMVFMGGVQYYTGQFYDLERISKAGHQVGALVGIDLAHAVGNVKLSLHDWGIDFAAWCTYKYLNAGPGSIGGIFVHEKHTNQDNKDKQVRVMAGWWGQSPETRFKMKHEWEGIRGAQAWQVSNPAVLPTVCLWASLSIFEDAGGMSAIRAKSLLLTGYLEYLIDSEIPKDQAEVITPRDPERRGCQLSLLTAMPVKPVHQQLEAAGVIVDVREPNVIRLAPCPLYNTFTEVHRFVTILKDSLDFAVKPKAKL
jgi:kynureninase